MTKRIKQLFSASVFMSMFVYFAQLPAESTKDFAINLEDLLKQLQPQQTIAAGIHTRPSFIPLEWKDFILNDGKISFWYPEKGSVKVYVDSYHLELPIDDGTNSEIKIALIQDDTLKNDSTYVEKEIVAIGGYIGNKYTNEQDSSVHYVLKNYSEQYVLVSFSAEIEDNRTLEKVLMSLQLTDDR